MNVSFKIIAVWISWANRLEYTICVLLLRAINFQLPGCMMEAKEVTKVYWVSCTVCPQWLRREVVWIAEMCSWDPTSVFMCSLNNRQLHHHPDCRCLSWNCCVWILWDTHTLVHFWHELEAVLLYACCLTLVTESILRGYQLHLSSMKLL